MSILKISFFGVYNVSDLKNSVFLQLLKNLSKKKIEVVSQNNADIIIIGPYNAFNYKKILLNKIFNIKIFKTFFAHFHNFDIYPFKRKYNPLRVFLSEENIHQNLPRYDYSFYHDLGIVSENHFRFPYWKENIDWAHEGIFREKTISSERFGSFYKIEDLLRPQGTDFLNKKRNVCIFSSHMNEPRNSIYKQFKKNFVIDGYGPYFDKNIIHHNFSNIKKREIMKNYSFNLCPENSLFPGYYTEKIPESFLGKCLPISWADHNISVDFNPKAFINLIDHANNNYDDICNLLKDDNYLLNYSKEPLLLKKPNLDKERVFIQRILSCI
jgi:hypothetical protein